VRSIQINSFRRFLQQLFPHSLPLPAAGATPPLPQILLDWRLLLARLV
jgi:hypothetical protein